MGIPGGLGGTARTATGISTAGHSALRNLEVAGPACSSPGVAGPGRRSIPTAVAGSILKAVAVGSIPGAVRATDTRDTLVTAMAGHTATGPGTVTGLKGISCTTSVAAAEGTANTVGTAEILGATTIVTEGRKFTAGLAAFAAQIARLAISPEGTAATVAAVATKSKAAVE